MKFLPKELRASGGLEAINPGTADDMFIACASFEPRTLFASEHLAAAYRAAKTVIYVNREFLSGHAGAFTKPHLYRLIGCLAKHSDAIEVAEGSWLSELDQVLAIRRALECDVDGVRSPERITLDCTTFNRESLLTLLAIVRTQWPECRLRLVYTSPEKHGEWLTRGFRTIRNVMGLCGTQVAGKPTVLVVMSGFEPHRTQRIIEEHEPSRLLLGVGDPPIVDAFLERNRMEQALFLARPDVERFHFPAGDIDQCRASLAEVVRPHIGNGNVILAPMSTKMSTVAALLVAEMYPEVQLTYCVPGEYNVQAYSSGVNSVFVAELPPQSPARESLGGNTFS